MKPRGVTRFLLALAGMIVTLASSVLAGPPLICHPIDIGPAKSLPLLDWNSTNTGGYDMSNLSRDTIAILDSDANVLVHMETLRRATIFARHDVQAAKDLFLKIRTRAERSNAGKPPDALARFDAGYLAEAYQQWLGKGDANPATGVDGYSWIRKAIALHGQDGEMEFAAALVTLSGPESAHREHVRNAMAGAKSDSLLAQNLTSRFRQETVAEMLTQKGSGVGDK